MFEIIPNWHPLFVHFTVSSLSLAVAFFVLSFIFKSHHRYPAIKQFAQWNLWLGSGFAIITAFTGWLAYNSVAHDTASHLAMTDHRNWALTTLVVFLVLAAWCFYRKIKMKSDSSLFLFAAILAFSLLSVTAWKGGEVVYRYGLGVMSMPVVSEDASGDGHDHEHGSVQLTPSSNTGTAVESMPNNHHDELSTQPKTIREPAHKDDGHSH